MSREGDEGREGKGAVSGGHRSEVPSVEERPDDEVDEEAGFYGEAVEDEMIAKDTQARDGGEAERAREDGHRQEGEKGDAAQGGLDGADFIGNAGGGAHEEGGGAVCRDMFAGGCDQGRRNSGDEVEGFKKGLRGFRAHAGEREKERSAEEGAGGGEETGEECASGTVREREA